MIRFCYKDLASPTTYYDYDFSSVFNSFTNDGKLYVILENIKTLIFNPDNGRYRRSTLKSQNLTFAEILYCNTYINPNGNLEKDMYSYETYMNTYFDGLIIRAIVVDNCDKDEVKFLVDHSSENKNKLLTIFIPSELSEKEYNRFVFKFIDMLLIERFINLVPLFETQVYKSNDGYVLLAADHCDSVTFIFIYNYLNTLIQKYINVTNYMSKNVNEIFESFMGINITDDILIEMVEEINLNILDRKEYNAEELVTKYYKKLKKVVGD